MLFSYYLAAKVHKIPHTHNNKGHDIIQAPVTARGSSMLSGSRAMP